MMGLIYIYSGSLILGMLISQVLDLTEYRDTLTLVTDTMLAYIMMEVGLEFIFDKKKMALLHQRLLYRCARSWVTVDLLHPLFLCFLPEIQYLGGDPFNRPFCSPHFIGHPLFYACSCRLGAHVAFSQSGNSCHLG